MKIKKEDVNSWPSCYAYMLDNNLKRIGFKHNGFTVYYSRYEVAEIVGMLNSGDFDGADDYCESIINKFRNEVRNER